MNDAPVPFNLDVSLGQATFSASGSSQDVLTAFADFQELIATPQLTSSDINNELDYPSKNDFSPIASSSAGENDRDEKVPLRVFLDAKVLPRGNSVIALGIAIWAKRYENTPEVDAETMKQLWRVSGRKIPTNIPRDLNTAASEGWLERRGKRTFTVTSYGEKHFDGLELTQ